VFHQYTLQLVPPAGTSGPDYRTALREHLAALNIPSMIYYPVPLHLQKAYAMDGSFPVTEQLCATVFSLPMHSELDTDTLKFITDSVLAFVNR
jgi:dTDP-4-amino-4,6-dideoxygalactose transaminase